MKPDLLIRAFEALETRLCLDAGALDPAFASGTVRDLTFAQGSSEVIDVDVQADGSILATGIYRVRKSGITTGQLELALARFNFDGSADTSFGANGLIRTTPGGLRRAIRTDLTPDGGFVVLGSTQNDTAGPKVLVRFHANGTVDTTFGVKGVAQLPLDAKSMSVDSAGRIVVAGSRASDDIPTAQEGVVLRLAADGRVDTSFNGGEFVVAARRIGTSGVHSAVFRSVAVDAQDRVLALGETSPTSSASLFLYRLGSSGKVDRTFGSKGTVFSPLQPIIAGTTADGRIILLGDRVRQLNPDGSNNTRYGEKGKSSAPVALGSEPHNGYAVASDGSVIYQRAVQRNDGSTAMRLSRITANGALDATFGAGGIVDLETDEALSFNAIDVAPDNTIVAGGVVGTISPSGKADMRRFAVARVLGGEGPAIQVVPRTLRTSSKYLFFAVHIRDDQGVSASSFDNNDLKFLDPLGNSRRLRVSSAQQISGANYYQAAYRIIAPDQSQWRKADNGVYSVRLQRRQIADLVGNFAMAQELGTMRIRIA